jgi:uncharacterized RDD family membrane protein YckC
MPVPDPHLEPEFYEHLVLKRLLAWVVDSVIALLITLLMVVFTAGLAAFVFPLAWFAASVAYRGAMLGASGATLGMILASTRMLTRDGGRLDMTTGFLHAAIHSLGMAMFAPQVVSVILILSGPQRRALADHLLGTVIVNRPA